MLKERKVSLISCDVSSLVVDTLCKQAAGGNFAVACFYFDFTGQKDQSPAAILGSVLKQIVGGLDEVPEGIVRAFQDRERVIGGRKLVLSQIVKFLRGILSSRRTFICIDALDECQERHRVELLDSLHQILQGSPGARVFLTGRPHIRDEVEKLLSRSVATRSIAPTDGDIGKFLKARLEEDAIEDAMDESLQEEIIRNVTKIFSEM